MTDLSPAAQAVYEAFWDGIRYNDDITNSNIAAALRAAADQVVPESCFESDDAIRNELFVIADELEKQAYEL